MSDYAAESGHWYKRDGTPMYEIAAKSGAMRPTTLRDARGMGLVPSVTTIIREAAAPGLERWKRQQLLMAALTLSRIDDESEADWLARVESDSREEGKKAADRGTAIHGAIECVIKDGYVPVNLAHLTPWAAIAQTALPAIDGRWSTERSFAHRHGYGGKVDLHCADWLIDIKTKDGIESAEVYDEHIMQLAAYRRGVGLKGKAGILFVDRKEPAAKLVQVEEVELERGLWMFDAMLLYYRWRTKYDASWEA